MVEAIQSSALLGQTQETNSSVVIKTAGHSCAAGDFQQKRNYSVSAENTEAPMCGKHQAPLSFTISWRLLGFVFIESVMPSNHLILHCPFLFLPSIFLSIKVFSNELVLRIRWPKYWNFSFSISPSSEHPGLISFRMDWLDLLAVQGTLKSLLQHHSSKAPIYQHSAFLTVQHSHPYMTTGKP